MSQVSVLLVEDSEEDAYLAMRVLRQQGVAGESIVWLQDGEEALHYLTEEQEARKRLASLRLILMDLKMPKLSGLEVLQRIRQDYSLHQLPVVIWSSSAEVQDIQASYALGSNSYLVKPMGYQEFSDAVSSLSSYWLKHNCLPQIS